MAYPLHLAFIWHQHQPLYKVKDPGGSSRYHLPWARLHGVKDYLDLVEVLAQFPRLGQTVNLSPTLLVQLQDYAQGEALDPYLTLSATPVAMLTAEQKAFALESFFDANYETQIAPQPRYRELYQERRTKGVLGCLEQWRPQDYEDLLAWHNLVWFDPLWRLNDAEIRHWFHQQHGFTLSDRQRILAKQRQIISRILPRHRQLQDKGQLEIITCPYSHPILPLLADSNSARSAQPDAPLPDPRFCWSEDIALQLRRAKALYRENFGRDPQGLWPPELAVSPEILPALAQARFQWLCADEEILARSLGHPLERDLAGQLSRPEWLYRPYRLPTADGDLSIVFRDQRLSDLIGFGYAHRSPEDAVSDFLAYLRAVALRLQSQQSQSTPGGLQYPWLVTIALDGENAWENYAEDGLPFLRLLYRSLNRLSERGQLELVTVTDYLNRFPPNQTLPPEHLHRGSWIKASYSTWIGERHKNQAWDYLIDARQTLAHHPEATEENNPEAWEALYAAEGSDWFWWFGEGNASAQDAIFDRLFREHLINFYQALNETVPSYLYHPLQSYPKPPAREPWGYIHPRIETPLQPEQWSRGGRRELAPVADGLGTNEGVQTLIYGWDLETFYLRLDWRPGGPRPQEFHLLWYFPGSPLPNSPAPLASVPDEAPNNYRFHQHLGLNLETGALWLETAPALFQWQAQSCQARFVLGDALALALPWHNLQQPPHREIHFVLLFAHQGEYQGRVWPGDLLKARIP